MLIVSISFRLGTGFWFFGYHIVRALGNKITQMSPTRGFSIELGAAITVLLASRLGLPVSTTQCLTGAAVGVALMNYDLGAVNWRQIAFIFVSLLLGERHLACRMVSDHVDEPRVVLFPPRLRLLLTF